MANIGPPKFLATCSCGRVLEKDASPYDDPYWTLCSVDIIPNGVPELKCPACGGDVKVPIGDYYYRRCPTNHQTPV